MKIIYVANVRIPTEMAHGLQIMKMCEAFSEHEVELVVPWRFSISKLGKKNPFDYYKIEKVFKISKIPSLDLTPLNRFLGPVSFLIQAFSFSLCSFFYLIVKKADIIYSRDRFSLFFLSFFRKNTIFEVHKMHRLFFKGTLGRVKKIIVISEGLKKALLELGIEEGKILVAPDAINLADFDVKKSKENCRETLDLPLSKRLIIYTGHLYKWKGVETLALSSKFLNDDMLIVIIGGIKWYLSNFKKFIEENKLKKVSLLGYQNYSKIPLYLKAADCLALTGTQASKVSEQYTSPMKMFEYMTSKRPIIASDLVSFREVLNKDNSILVKADSPQAMAEGIKTALSNQELAEKISEQAYKDVQEHTWAKRTKKILNFIKA